MLRVVKRLLMGIGIVVGFFLVMQAIPYGRDHTNPEVVKEPAWDSPATRDLAKRACFDCHSNETKWPWYSHVAPVSWVLQRHVDTARDVLNFSDWEHKNQLAGQAAANVLAEEMPPRSYRMFHPEAQLSDRERLQLAKGLQATFGLPWHD